MPFDFKKEYKEFYLPKNKPEIVTVPAANYIAVQGSGDPNEEGGAYQNAICILYAVAYTLKMSYKTGRKIDGFFEYVVPPLEGFWQTEAGVEAKDAFQWISVIRLPDFVTPEVFDWAVHEAAEKKKKDFSAVKYFTYEEGLCVQCMHLGPYDNEPATVSAMAEYAKAQGYEADFGASRFHHEIYLSDVRRCKPERLKTVIRHPTKRTE